MTRRLVLAVACVSLAGTGLVLPRSAVSAPAQVDVEGYGGTGAGGWACGPTARATYAGAGANVRVHLNDQPAAAAGAGRVLEPEGASVEVGGAAESRGYERLTCAGDPCGAEDVVPPRTLLGAGRAKVGHDARYWGVRAGALVYMAWDASTDRLPTGFVLPDLDLRVGRRVGFRGVAGFGGYDAPTLLRPGGYLGFGYTDVERGWSFDMRGGLHEVFDRQLGVRGDVAFLYPFGNIAPGLGAAMSSGEQLGAEGRVLLRITP